AEADPVATNRRATAVTLLNSLADEARGFRDPNLRARVQAQAANALWETDRERAVALFRRAWDAAESADQENQRRREETRNAQDDGRTLARNLNVPNMRAEVLRLAAKRDRALGEEFLGELNETRKQEDKDANASAVAAGANAAAEAATGGPQPRRDPLATPPDAARRLRLAMQFLGDGETERALQFAEPALGQPYQMTVEFLVMLREKDAAAADQRYAALLTRTALDPQSDANTILMLSSYVLTPHMYMTFEPGGGISTSQRRRDITRPDLPAPILQVFVNTAAQVLLRPVPPPDQDQTSSGRAGIYFVIARLLPFIEQIDPSKGPALRTQLAALTPDLPARARGPEFERDLMRGLVPETEDSEAAVQEALDEASRTTDPERRNSRYATAAMRAARGNDTRALDIADKIDNTDLRRQVRAYIQFVQLNQAIEKKDGAEVLRLVASASEITRSQRTWGYTEAARLLAKTDRPRALEALEAAVAEARRIDAEDPDRVRSIVAAATQYFELDRNRAWEIMAEAVKASNNAADYTGADSGLAVRVQARGTQSTINFSVSSFDLTPVFTTLAKDDMNRAIELAKAFTNEAPRAVATIAIARAVLEK
ncbi:MAG: hypothetical protein M3371_02770, partial [Acidobacteriota bacterium]|nr:hypothetical protein [Acidobacteriota bacterium]